MTFDRKEFNILLEDVLSYKIDTVYISYKDRLARTSFNMIKSLFERYGTKLVVIDEETNKKTFEQEFLEEVVSLIHSFSMKMYSKRRKRKLDLIKQDIQLESEIDVSNISD